MKEGTRNLLVGSFVVGSFFVLGVLMVWFGEAPSWLGGSEWELRITDVPELGGIGAGSPVKLNGVEIGRVKRLEFADPARPHQGVAVVAGIKNLYSIPGDATARIYGATLGFGTGHVEIVCDPKSQVPPLDRSRALIRGEMRSIVGEVIRKELGGSLEEMIVRVGELAKAAEPVARNLALLIEQRSVASVDQPGALARGVTANLATVIERLDQVGANINAVLGDRHVQGDIKTAVTDLKTATTQLRETTVLWKTESGRILDRLDKSIEHTDKNLDESFARLTRVLDNLDAASTSMATLLQRIDAGEGTAGRLVRDDRLYEAGALTLERLSELIGTLQRILGKAEQDGYIKVGKATPVGTLTKKVPVGEAAAKALSKLSGLSEGPPLPAPADPP